MSIDVKTFNISEIKPYKNNPRNNDEAIGPVMESIREFGFKVPIIIDKNNVVVAGHTRLKAAIKLGLDEVPCIVADDLTDEQINAFRLADNKVSEFATWDMELLDIELDNIVELDMSEFGFDLELHEENESTEIIDDIPPKLPEEPKSKRGDIYQLGNHRLMCGDSTSTDYIERLLDGNKANLVFTDPPYGMKKAKDGVINDNLNYDDLLEFNKLWIPLTFQYLKDNGSWYCWGIDEPLMDIYSNILKPMIRANKITFRNLITWDKGSGQGQNSDLTRMYAIADEKCLFVMCGVQGFNNNSDNYYDGWDSIRLYLENEAKNVNLTASKLKEICGVGMYSHWFTKSQWVLIPRKYYEKLHNYYNGEAFSKDYEALKKDYEALKKDYEALKKDYYDTRAYFNNTHDNMNNVWHFNRLTAGTEELKSAGGHATPKPIILCSRAIMSSSQEGDIILDVFGGSGSTLITCEQLDRICYMMEYEPKWVDVIIQRWEKLTGKKAILIYREKE